MRTPRLPLLPTLVGLSSLLALPACADDSAADGSETGGNPEVPSVYEFESRFAPDESSVSYGGQTFRQLLVVAMTNEIAEIQREIVEDAKVFADGEVEARLNFYYQFDSATGGSLPIGVETTPPALQSTWDEVSSDKDLQGKIAGNDAKGQHADWSTEFVGWDGSSPDETIAAFIATLDDMAVAYSSGTIPTDPDGAQIPVFYVDAMGRDYSQLLPKLLLGAVNFSQGADDYLDDDIEGSGLQADNSAADEGSPYTALEHAWDEGFGYFGAARGYLDYSDDEIAGAGGRDGWSSGYHDADADGFIDLGAEYNFGAAVNAAKRDRGSTATTDFTRDAMEAFLAGRHIIATADGALDDASYADLQAQRDIAVDAWEKAIAATAVHYINDTLADMSATEYDFVGHAKHWSELKGFALSLQFNPRSPVGDADFATLHDLLGTAPVLPGGDLEAYAADLRSARQILGDAYGFDAANLGDDDGQGGW